MNLLRKILFPFAAIYGAVTLLRNFFYDRRLFKSARFDIPTIAVGNLSVGGTGKSPQIEYLIRLLSQNYNVATLSRGYKRKSTGFVLADANATVETLGGEPYQFFRKFPNVQVAVDADRTNGIRKLLQLPQKPDVVLLDDAFRHRKVCAGLYILLTPYDDLYVDEFLLPTGNLRESRRGAKRANIIIVTKCPRDLSTEARLRIQMRLKLKPKQQLFFSYVDYDSSVYGENPVPVELMRTTSKVLVAGIAKPRPFFDYLKADGDLILEFADHHHFTSSDISEILGKAASRPIVTTEKDYVRLENQIPKQQLHYLPIRSAFISSAEKFDQTILDYVGKSTANSSIH